MSTSSSCLRPEPFCGKLAHNGTEHRPRLVGLSIEGTLAIHDELDDMRSNELNHANPQFRADCCVPIVADVLSQPQDIIDKQGLAHAARRTSDLCTESLIVCHACQELPFFFLHCCVYLRLSHLNRKQFEQLLAAA